MEIMWQCNDCKKICEEPSKKSVCLEDFYGVGSEFSDSHYQVIPLCPYCKSEEVDEVEGDFCSMCGDFTSYNDLEDTEGLTNGGIGKICPDCWEDFTDE